MFPITVVDNFFKNPDNIRDFAINQQFSRSENCGWPGSRSPMLLDIDMQFHRDVMSKILSSFFRFPEDALTVKFEAFFQSIQEQYEEGWCHIDNGVDLAGVVYLTPNSPVDAGTSIYNSPSTKIDFSVCKNKSLFYDDKITDLSEYRNIRDLYNSNFTKILDIGNVYNRLVMYPGDYFHRENKFFGKSLLDSRLTLVFFINIRTNNCLNPLQRIQQIPL